MTRLLFVLLLMSGLAGCGNVEDTLINRSNMSKVGVELGQVTLFFRRQTEGMK